MTRAGGRAGGVLMLPSRMISRMPVARLLSSLLVFVYLTCNLALRISGTLGATSCTSSAASSCAAANCGLCSCGLCSCGLCGLCSCGLPPSSWWRALNCAVFRSRVGSAAEGPPHSSAFASEPPRGESAGSFNEHASLSRSGTRGRTFGIAGRAVRGALEHEGGGRARAREDSRTAVGDANPPCAA